MIRVIDHKKMGKGEHDWLESFHHFSFANYYNPSNIKFGVLRVINDDIVQPAMGFGAHSHQNMEILSYVIDGELTHNDSMKNQHTLTRGQAQYMSAGTGVVHSEFNLAKEPLRFLQIWIFPDKDNLTPNYGEHRFDWADRINKWLPIASSSKDKLSQAPIKIHNDVNIFATFLDKGKKINFSVESGRQAYLILIEGSAKINDKILEARDALEITEEMLDIVAVESSHALIIEMKKEIH